MCTLAADRSITAIYERQRLEGTIPQRGDAVVWSEPHHSGPYRMDWDEGLHTFCPIPNNQRLLHCAQFGGQLQNESKRSSIIGFVSTETLP